MKWFKSQQGFTMIEMAVVAAIIAIMAVVAVPSIRAWIPRQQIRAVKRDIVSSMQLGRMKAIGRGSNFYIDFDHDNDGSVAENIITCYLDTDSDGADGEVNNAAGENEYVESQITFPDTDAGVPVIRFPAHVTLGYDTGVTPIGASLPGGVGFNLTDTLREEFEPNGRAAQGVVYIRSDRGENFAITVNLLGRVSVLKWNGTNWQ